MSRKATRTLNVYAIQFESEGRRWCESVKAPTIYDAELLAASEARRRRLRVNSTFARCFTDSKGWAEIKAQSLYQANTKVVLSKLGADTPISVIDLDLIETYVQSEISAGYAKSTIDGRLACLGKMFNLAVNKWKVLKYAPKMPYFHENNARVFVLSASQEAELFQAVLSQEDTKPSGKGGPPRKKDSRIHYLLFTVLVEGGMRLGEALRIRWEDVDTEGGSMIIKLHRKKELKNGKPRSVPLTDLARAAVEECRGRHPTGPFGGLTKRRAQHLWTEAKAKVGITDKECVIHAQRHTCATRLLKSVGDIKLVQEWLGHTALSTTSNIYAHVETERLVDAAGALTRLRASRAGGTTK